VAVKAQEEGECSSSGLPHICWPAVQWNSKADLWQRDPKISTQKRSWTKTKGWERGTGTKL